MAIMKQAYLIILLTFPFILTAQVSQDSDLFKTFKKLDSTFFERGFNQCDIAYLENHISVGLRFFHDQSGFQDRQAFIENTKKSLCANPDIKPIRKVDSGSLEVFPLYSSGVLYGVIQKGKHNFYLRESGKKDVWTSRARFTHVWVLNNKTWQISEVLSYDHQNSIDEDR